METVRFLTFYHSATDVWKLNNLRNSMQYRQHVCYTFTSAFALSSILSKEVKLVVVVLNVPTCLSIKVCIWSTNMKTVNYIMRRGADPLPSGIFQTAEGRPHRQKNETMP